ncbi:MAG TPA: hypothetical protein VG265_05690 [Gaiellaceae bacterium]|nr:hypothetical protein [Gaiellaceae bacterium]
METRTHLHPHSHSHDQDHSHADDHVHHSASVVRSQPVVLDLGDGVGALIVHVGPELLGVEVEISPAGEDGNRQHKEVLQRAMGRETGNVLVYDNLPEGEYTLWIDDVARARGVRVPDGSVAEIDWRDREGS